MSAVRPRRISRGRRCERDRNRPRRLFPRIRAWPFRPNQPARATGVNAARCPRRVNQGGCACHDVAPRAMNAQRRRPAPLRSRAPPTPRPRLASSAQPRPASGARVGAAISAPRRPCRRGAGDRRIGDARECASGRGSSARGKGGSRVSRLSAVATNCRRAIRSRRFVDVRAAARIAGPARHESTRAAQLTCGPRCRTRTTTRRRGRGGLRYPTPFGREIPSERERALQLARRLRREQRGEPWNE